MTDPRRYLPCSPKEGVEGGDRTTHESHQGRSITWSQTYVLERNQGSIYTQCGQGKLHLSKELLEKSKMDIYEMDHFQGNL